MLLDVFTFTPQSYNPPAVYMGTDSCLGYADPIKSFGNTPETEALIEISDVQKKLLRGEVPYKCKHCDLVFFVSRKVISMYKQAFEWAGMQAPGRLPKDILCERAYYTVDRSSNPPSMVRNQNVSRSTVSKIGRQINLKQDPPTK